MTNPSVWRRYYDRDGSVTYGSNTMHFAEAIDYLNEFRFADWKRHIKIELVSEKHVSANVLWRRTFHNFEE